MHTSCADKQFDQMNLGLGATSFPVSLGQPFDFFFDALGARPAAIVLFVPPIAEHGDAGEPAVFRRQHPCGLGELLVLVLLRERFEMQAFLGVWIRPNPSSPRLG
jgi:hypothetical protein